MLYIWSSPGQNIGVGSLSFLQWIFTTQKLNQGLPHCRQILYQLSYWGSPPIQGIHTEISLSCFADAETSPSWEEETVC